MSTSPSVCVIADTHNNVDALGRALELAASFAPSILIHCGDLTDPAVVAVMGSHLEDHFEMPPEVYIVYGNNDYDVFAIDQACRRRGYRVGPFHEIAVNGRQIFACHGHKRFRESAIAAGQYDVVFSGHTHVKEDETIGTTRIVNPGALHRAREYSFVHYDVDADTIRFVPVSK